MNINRTALVLVDLQNDFLHDEGAFGRANKQLQVKRTLIEQLIKVVNAARQSNIKIISTQFTFIADKDNQPIIDDILKEEWPFLKRGDFQISRWGFQLMDELAPADYVVPKIADSGFYMTHLDWLLKKLGINQLLFGGIVTNAGIASTVKDAQQMGYETFILKDGCAAENNEIHQETLEELSQFSTVLSCAEWIESFVKVSGAH